MITVKASTKKGQMLIARAQHFEGYNLYDVYGKCSYAKQQAYHYCLSLFAKEHGTNFGIVSHNTFGFSVAWKVADGWRLETPQNSYHVIETK